MELKDTLYKGIVYRSKTEAIWASFFDELGVKVEYEKKMFTFESGLKYLPDFYLPEQKCWVEIKNGIMTKKEHDKAILLKNKTREEVWILNGVPKVEKFVCDFTDKIVSEVSGFGIYLAGPPYETFARHGNKTCNIGIMVILGIAEEIRSYEDFSRETVRISIAAIKAVNRFSGAKYVIDVLAENFGKYKKGFIKSRDLKGFMKEIGEQNQE